MVYYLDNGDAFLLYLTPSMVVFVPYSGILERIIRKDCKWISRDIFKRGHFDEILDFISDKDQGNRNIGKVMLEQSLKVVINGEIVGNNGEDKLIR